MTEWMTLPAAAELAGRGEGEVYTAMRRAEIRGLRTAEGEWRVDRAALLAWAAS